MPPSPLHGAAPTPLQLKSNEGAHPPESPPQTHEPDAENSAMSHTARGSRMRPKTQKADPRTPPRNDGGISGVARPPDGRISRTARPGELRSSRPGESLRWKPAARPHDRGRLSRTAPTRGRESADLVRRERRSAPLRRESLSWLARIVRPRSRRSATGRRQRRTRSRGRLQRGRRSTSAVGELDRVGEARRHRERADAAAGEFSAALADGSTESKRSQIA